MSSTHYHSNVTTGPLDDDAIVETFIAEEANIKLWSPVVLVAAGAGEYLARAGPTANASDPKVIGVVVGPLRDAENLYASLAAGDAIQVCTHGKCKVRVDGTDAIAVGDALVTYAADYYAKLMVADPNFPAGGDTTYYTAAIEAAMEAAVTAMIAQIQAGFAIALYAATVDGDIIPCFVYGARGTET